MKRYVTYDSDKNEFCATLCVFNDLAPADVKVRCQWYVTVDPNGDSCCEIPRAVLPLLKLTGTFIKEYINNTWVFCRVCEPENVWYTEYTLLSDDFLKLISLNRFDRVGFSGSGLEYKIIQ